jgi:hypothetical protein
MVTNEQINGVMNETAMAYRYPIGQGSIKGSVFDGGVESVSSDEVYEDLEDLVEVCIEILLFVRGIHPRFNELDEVRIGASVGVAGCEILPVSHSDTESHGLFQLHDLGVGYVVCHAFG